MLQKYSQDLNQQLVGKTMRVIVTGRDRKEGYLSGLTEGRIVLRFASENSELTGKFTDVTITSATPFSLEGLQAPSAVLTPVER